MKRILKHALPLLAGAIVSLSASAQQGTWLTQSGNLEVEIAPCDQALCGTVVKEIASRSMSGDLDKAFKDTRPALGMKILQDFTTSDEKEWKGHIYNRENGETYDCILSLAVSGELKVHGYKGLRMFGRTQTWTRLADRAPK